MAPSTSCATSSSDIACSSPSLLSPTALAAVSKKTSSHRLQGAWRPRQPQPMPCLTPSAASQDEAERSLVLEDGADGVPGKAGSPGAADPATCCREASGVSTDTTMDDRVLCPLPAKYAPETAGQPLVYHSAWRLQHCLARLGMTGRCSWQDAGALRQVHPALAGNMA